jgi:hypothetical protein
MLYDILVLDNVVSLKEPHDKHRERLCSLIKQANSQPSKDQESEED